MSEEEARRIQEEKDEVSSGTVIKISGLRTTELLVMVEECGSSVCCVRVMTRTTLFNHFESESAVTDLI